MKILIISLLLFTGLSQAPARSLPWISHTLDADDWLDNDYDLFRFPTNQPNDDFYKVLMGGDSEQSKEVEISAEKKHHSNLFGTTMGLLLDIADENTNSNENLPNNSNEKRENDDVEEDDEEDDEKRNNFASFLDRIFSVDGEKSSELLTNSNENLPNNSNEKRANGDGDEEEEEEEDETKNNLTTHLDEIFGADGDKSSEETTNSNENTANNSEEKRENDADADEEEEEDEIKKNFTSFLDEIFGADGENSSEETKPLKREYIDSFEDSEELAPNLKVNNFDLAKSSEETQDVSAAKNNSSEEDKTADNSNEATEVTDMTNSSEDHNTADEFDDLSEMDVTNLVSFFIALNILNDNMQTVIQTPETKDELARGKEVDEILDFFGSALDKILEEESLSKQIKSDEEDADANAITTTTAEVESEEEDDSYEATTPITSHNEDTEDGSESHGSEENSNFVYVVFKSFDEDDDEQRNLNGEKYSVIDSQQELKPTSAPYMPEIKTTSLSTSMDAQNSINEYVEIRENLDEQQDFLQKHELDLDKDFYAIVSNNFEDNNLNKFEKDIYAVQENLDRIKKNINAIQNLQTKLYFHKLVAAAVRDAQNQPHN